MLLQKFILVVLTSITSMFCLNAQQVYFIDGYHGGVYGHYPKQYTAFISDMLDKHPEWYVNLEIEPETWDTVALHEPDNYQRFQKLIADQSVNGRIEYVNPAYGQPYLYNINGESCIRQFRYGIDKLKKHFPSLVFTTYSSEEPCFTSALPQILKSFGFEYASLKNPNTCWGGYTRNYGGEMIDWQGPDGSLLPTVPRYAVEALDKNSTWQTTASTNSREYLDAAFAAGIEHPIGMCLQDAEWKGGPWLKPNNMHYPTRYTTWRKYAKDIVTNRELPAWEFSQEDVQVSLVWGAQVLQQIAKQVRFSENKVVRAEKIATLAGILKGANYPTASFDEAWRQIMLAQHHDCWIVPYNGKKNDTWIDKVQRWTDSANNISCRTIQSSVVAFNRNITEPSFYVRLFNSNADELNGCIRVPVPAELRGKAIAINDLKGNILPSQLDTLNNELIVKARIPGVSLCSWQLKKTAESKTTGSLVSKKNNGTYLIETDFYKIVIDPAKGGAITSFIAKQLNNREFVDIKKGVGFNELKGYFFRDSKYFSSSATKATVRVVNDGALSTSLEISGVINQHPFVQVITVGKSDPLIDVKLKIDWKGNPGIGDEYKQNGGFKFEDYEKAFYDDRKKLQTLFPLNFTEERVYKNAPFDVTESKLNNTYFRTWDSIKNNVLLNWIDITDKNGTYGFALFTDHTTAYSHGQQDPLGLVTQYSGVGLWGRNYSIAGPTEIHYAFYPHAGNWEKAGVWATNVNWNNTPEVSISSNPVDINKNDISLFSIKQKGFELTAMQKQGNDLLIRLFNPSSTAKAADLHFGNASFSAVQMEELDGRVIKNIKPGKTQKGKAINVPMRRFGFATLLLKNFSKEK